MISDSLDSTPTPTPMPNAPNRAIPTQWIDLAVITMFVIVAAGLVFVRWRGVQPFIFLTSDAGNIASFAVAHRHPELFEGDELLGNLHNVQFYSTIHVDVIGYLGQAIGDYGLAFVALLGPHIVLMAAGFYWLGVVLFKSRYWALLFVVACLTTFKWKLDLWGLYVDPTPRISFQSLMPFVMAAAFRWRSSPRVWPAIAAASGVLMYVHPVSAPTFAFALWCGFVPYLPGNWSLPRKAAWMLICGFTFLLVAAPFAVNYLTSHAHGETVDYPRVYAAMQDHFTQGYLDIPRAVSDYFSTGLGLWLAGVVAFVLVHVRNRKTLGDVLVFDGWIVGIVLTSIVLPLTEQWWAHRNGVIPVEVDLIRNVRYLIPCVMILVALALAAPLRDRARPRPAIVPAVVGLALVGAWAWVNTAGYAKHAVSGTMKRQYSSPTQQQDWIQIIDAVSQTPERSRILPVGKVDPLPIRYHAQRPVVHCKKDGGCLAYSNHEALLKWHDIHTAVAEINRREDPREWINGFVALGRKLDADFLLVRAPSRGFVDWIESVDGIHVQHKTDAYVLLRIDG